MLTPGQRLRLPLADLTQDHPLLRKLPAPWASDDAQLLALADDMRQRLARGEDAVIDALKITPTGQLADGRHRRNAARLAKVPDVACEVVAESAVPGLIRASFLHRRHYTKGQRAYLCVPLFEAEFEAAEERMLTGAANPAHSMRRVSERVRTLDECALEIGVSKRVLQQAKELHDLFAAHPEPRLLGVAGEQVEATFHDYFEAALLAEEDPEAPQTRSMSLGGAIKGIKQVLEMEKKGGKSAHPGGRPKDADKQLRLFEDVLETAAQRFRYWNDWDAETQTDALKHLPPFVESTPTEVLARLVKLGKAELSRRTAQEEAA